MNDYKNSIDSSATAIEWTPFVGMLVTLGNVDLYIVVMNSKLYRMFN